MTKWQIRRILLGDRRRTDRVLNEAKAALQRLDRALSSVEQATELDRRRQADER